MTLTNNELGTLKNHFILLPKPNINRNTDDLDLLALDGEPQVGINNPYTVYYLNTLFDSIFNA